jgi:serpin B
MMPRTVLVPTLAGLLAACGAEAEQATEPTPPGEEARSALSRNPNPSVPPADLSALVSGNTAFALNLHRELAAAGGNVFFSPHSISTALAMTYAGARGDTAAQMEGALDFRLPEARLHPAFNAVDLALESRGQGASGRDGQPFRLRVENALFAQRDYQLLPDFLDTLAVHYGAGVSLMDFVEDTEGSRVAINDWVDQATEGRISELIPPGVLSPATVLVLTNAVYFNASWKDPFEPSATTSEPFAAPSGPVTVDMMRQTTQLPHASGAGWEAVALPYDGDELDMVVVVPQGDLSTLEAQLDPALVSTIFGGLRPAQVTLGFPKFETRYASSLVEPLGALGMRDAFTGAANLSGMDGTRRLFIQDILHEAFVAVDEAGTEAAAATAVVVGRTSAPGQQVRLTVDRPFLFLIRDRATNAIVFMGRIVDPS